jgi:hypothetical protein
VAYDQYEHELKEAAFLLNGVAVAAVRGEGAARFIYAVRDNRAIELSRSDAGWWVEFWENELVASENTFAAFNEAIAAGKSWLAHAA